MMSASRSDLLREPQGSKFQQLKKKKTKKKTTKTNGYEIFEFCCVTAPAAATTVPAPLAAC